MSNPRPITEEKLLPLVRARLAKRLSDIGFRAKEISAVLNVTPAAVTQYLKGKRGNTLSEAGNELIINALADKAAHRIRSEAGPLGAVELLDAGYQLLSASKGQKILKERAKAGGFESIGVLRDRLRLELKAAEKCLELANRTRDDYTKLFLRMIASDSIRHADIVSQLISYSERASDSSFQPPAKEFLNEMLAIEDKASEASLSKAVKIPNKAAMLLLESIDMDEFKHDRLVGKMLRLGPNPAKKQ